MKNEKNKGCLSVEEVANYLGCGRSTAYELVRKQDFPTIRLGRRIIVPLTALQEWLQKQTGGDCT